MLAYSQHNLGMCGDQRPPNWPLGPLLGLQPSFGDFSPSKWGEGGGADKHTEISLVYISLM